MYMSNGVECNIWGVGHISIRQDSKQNTFRKE